MRKIVFITPALTGGGAERNIVNITHLLDKEAFDITVLACCDQEDHISVLPPGVKSIYLKKSRVLSASFDIIKIITKIKPDVVFTSLEHLSFFITLYKIITRQRYVNVIRLPTLPSNKLAVSLKSKILYCCNTYLFRKADFIVTQSEQMKDEAINLMKISPSKVITIFNPINKEQIFSLSETTQHLFNNENYNIVSAGTLYPVKGFDLLIESISIVKKSIPNVKLHIFGKEKNGENYMDFLEQLTIKCNIKDDVIFHGFKSNIYPYMKQADLFVLSSRKEGFPNVVLESLTLGTPVVATNCVDFKGIIYNNVNGYVVQKESIPSLAEGITKAVNLKKVKSDFINFDYNKWFNDILN